MDAKVHDELIQFMTHHSLDDCTGNIDEIVLSYLVGVVELVSQGDDATDFEDVLDMLNAYLPGFDKIPRADVVDWMFGLAGHLEDDKEGASQKEDECCQSFGDDAKEDSGSTEQNLSKDENSPVHTEKRHSFPCYEFSNSESHSPPTVQNGLIISNNSTKLTHITSNESSLKENNVKEICKSPQETAPCDGPTTNSNIVRQISSEKKSHKKRKGRQLSCSSQESQEDPVVIEEVDVGDTEPRIRTLLEMFPSACTMEAQHCLQLSNGDMDRAAQLIMDRQESGQAISIVNSIKTKKGGQKTKKLSNYKLDDDSIKMSVLQKYSFVDTEDDKRTYRPPPPKGEAKKLVRYRNGQVVSLKGERFSEIKKDTDTKS